MNRFKVINSTTRLIGMVIFLIELLVIIPGSGQAQTVGISATGSSPDASAGLDVDFSNKGLLIPRMTSAQRDAISTPATSLLIFQTDNTPGYYFYNGASWTMVLSGSSGASWSVSGNTGTNPSVNFIGNRDSIDLVLSTHAIERMRILSSGNVGIGNLVPDAYLAIKSNVSDNSKTAFNVKDQSNNVKLAILSDGHIAINQTDASSGIIDSYSSGSNEGYRLTNDGASTSIRLWLASEDGLDGSSGLAYLTRGGQAISGICIDDNNDAGHYGAVGICLDNDGNNSTPPPNSTLQVNGSFSSKIVGVSDTYTLNDRDYFLKVVTGTSDKTITLPLASTCKGRIYFVKKTDAGIGKVILTADGSELIDESTTFEITGQYTSVSVISDGENWFIMNR
jgi:hypothetical protein